MTGLGRRGELIASTCAIALVVAGVLLVAPGLLPVGPELLAGGASLLGATALGGLLAIAALLRGATGRSAAAPMTTSDRDPPVCRPGTEFDERLAAATTADRLPETERDRRQAALQADLRELVVERYRQQMGVDRETATEAVAQGTWTTDPVAAAYLGSEADDVPLWEWLRLLSHPNGTVYAQVARTVDALDGELA